MELDAWIPVLEPLNVAHGILDKHTFTWLDAIVLKTIGDIKDSTAEEKCAAVDSTMRMAG